MSFKGLNPVCSQHAACDSSFPTPTRVLEAVTAYIVSGIVENLKCIVLLVRGAREAGKF